MRTYRGSGIDTFGARWGAVHRPASCPPGLQDFGRQLLQAVNYMHELRLVHTGAHYCAIEREAAPSEKWGGGVAEF